MAREPFKSGVTDYVEIRKRMDEIGIKPLGSEHGVDVTPPEKPAEETQPGYICGY